MPAMLDTAAFWPFTQSMRERSGWIVTDGRMGPVSAASGVAGAVGLKFEHKRIAGRATWSTLPARSILDPGDGLDNAEKLLVPPWPEIAIAAGNRTMPYLQALRRASEGATFTVALQHHVTRSDLADLIWCPAHEGCAGANIISTLTTPHVMRPHALADLRKLRPPEIDALSGPLVAVLIGGPNRLFRYDNDTLARFGACLRKLADSGASFLITPSRRTTAALLRTAVHATHTAQRIIWDGRGPNPYWTFLAQADVTVVTGDSVNMVSEACVTGRPVYVFESLAGSVRIAKFHEGLQAHGATRPLTPDIDPAEQWRYRPLDAAPRIAAEIACRFNSSSAPRRPGVGFSATRS
jgi:uncharacterized protein